MSKTYTHIALVDCNNFFVSCERLFRPDLVRTPVIVLSSNDGCVISRSNEVKALGVNMGEPYFRVRDRCKKHGIHVFSSNFALYRDLSRRVMCTLHRFSDNVEVYSVDEAFLTLSVHEREQVRPPSVLWDQANTIQATVLREVGIPVSVGVAPTKTLAKVATHLAKRGIRIRDPYTGGEEHVRDATGTMLLLDPAAIDAALSETPVSEVWGVGFRLAPTLRAHGIETAADLVRQPDHWIRKCMSVRGVRTAEELRGTRRLDVAEDHELRKSLLHSRSFGVPVTAYADLAAAVAFHARKVAEVLRAEHAVAREVVVSVRTSRHRVSGRYAAADMEVFVVHTNDTLELVQAALRVLSRIYRSNVAYAKAGVMVRDILHEEALPGHTLFGRARDERAPLMQALDALRQRYGDVVRVGAERRTETWSARHDRLSPAYTTTWGHIPTVPLVDSRPGNILYKEYA